MDKYRTAPFPTEQEMEGNIQHICKLYKGLSERKMEEMAAEINTPKTKKAHPSHNKSPDAAQKTPTTPTTPDWMNRRKRVTRSATK